MIQNPSFFSSFTSSFTPAVLFLLLNLTIAAIALISSLTRHHHHHHHHHDDHAKIFRSPSILQRLKSINIYALSSDPIPKSFPNFNHHHEPEPAPTTDSVIGKNGEEKDEDENEFETMDEIYSKLKGVQFGRTKSDTEPGSGLNRAPVPNPARVIRKSASMKPKAKYKPVEEINSVEARRPATARERVLGKVTEGDVEVDAKADDFINNFKKELQLQRLDSILKNKRGEGR